MNAYRTGSKLISGPSQSLSEPTFILKGEKIAYLQDEELYIMNIDEHLKRKFLKMVK